MSILEDKVNAFHAFIAELNKDCASEDPKLKQYATIVLNVIASKNGNDLLETQLVEFTGRKPKAVDQKHGADSEDGELEAKPVKGPYTAHISDDTPSSLLRHHTIPFIILGVFSENGQRLQWAILTSYRVFDQARYQKMVTEFVEPEKRADFPELLPLIWSDRKAVLERLEGARPAKKYVRSNSLPLRSLHSLEPGQYCIWIHPDCKDKKLLTLKDREIPMSSEYITQTQNYRLAALGV